MSYIVTVIYSTGESGLDKRIFTERFQTEGDAKSFASWVENQLKYAKDDSVDVLKLEEKGER